MAKRPGSPVRGSTTGRPIMVLLDVLGQRWSLRILWELNFGRMTFRDLRSRCDDLSPTILNKRLGEFRTLSLVDLDKSGYGLTKSGVSLIAHLAPLDSWANEWAENIDG